MTLPPEKLGDKGQRYEIRYIHEWTKLESVFGWAADKASAESMKAACLAWPNSKRVWIVDRQKPQKPKSY